MSSKKNTSNKPPILIDTSFLLPALGVEVNDEIRKAITKFREYTIYYLEISLIKAMWSVIKRVDINDQVIIKIGLEAIKDTYRKLDLLPEHIIEAWKIYKEAHKDFIDAPLYSVSLIENIPFLTSDRRLKDNLKRAGFPVKNILFPLQLK